MTSRKRTTSSYTHYMEAEAGAVFPLLCPVREYEWIEWWRATLLHSLSGVAEQDCVFTSTVLEAVGPEVWTCTRYEPPQRIDYVRVGRSTVIRLELTLAPAGPGTLLTARMVVSALDDAGDAIVDEFAKDGCEGYFKPGAIMLGHYLAKGTLLPAAEALALAS
ncbi:MAG: hypothetical protein KKF77_13750 [Proteobacteria bacterium]|nr:hypothetical protein [Pseudomonadota bacterium]